MQRYFLFSFVKRKQNVVNSAAVLIKKKTNLQLVIVSNFDYTSKQCSENVFWVSDVSVYELNRHWSDLTASV